MLINEGHSIANFPMMPGGMNNDLLFGGKIVILGGDL